jgi:hypothetical protein
MAAGEPVHWGNIEAGSAKLAAALLEKGERREMKRFPFDTIVVDEELQEVVNVKEEVEHVRQVHPSRLQGTNTNTGFDRPERDLG